MTEHERDLIYKVLPRLTDSIDNLAEKIDAFSTFLNNNMEIANE